MPRNIELKARLGDLPAARRIAEAIATDRLGVEHQVDTYFHTPTGRLKLREIDGEAARLVAYLRPDDAGPKGSDYVLVPIPDPAAARTKLESLMSERWTWGVLPNNCVSFVEEVIAAGGGTWASASNCPSVATAPTIINRISEFLNRLDSEIYRIYRVPRL